MNKTIIDFFRDISAIPRCSGDEQGMSRYLLRFAAERNLEAFKEEPSGNIIIKKKASSGYENSKTVILQGHMDMVCEKNTGVNHDFTKDPLRLLEKDGWLCAEGTTLGADNGVAVAYALAILDDPNLKHPPLEVLITTDEETSMKGAEQLLASSLTGNILLNLDAGDEGVFFVSSAGGKDYRHILTFDPEPSSKTASLQIQVSGLKGGHSGEDIDKERGNSIKLLGRVLHEIRKRHFFELHHLWGGSKVNAIPREAAVILFADPADLENIRALLAELQGIFNNELKGSDHVILTLETTEAKPTCVDKITTDKLIDLLLAIPSGVQKISKEIDGLVVCSQNLGVLQMSENAITLFSSIRSSEESLKEFTVQKMDVLTRAFQVDSASDSDYPAWAYQSDSPVRDLAAALYEEQTGKKAEILAIHAGLECGFFAEILKNNPIDILSFGPTMKDIHSPDERLDISSFERVYQFLIQLLRQLK